MIKSLLSLYRYITLVVTTFTIIFCSTAQTPGLIIRDGSGRVPPGAVSSVLALTSFSQTSSKPKQFNNFPEKINCSEQELASVFNAAPGQAISINFSDNFIFSGSVKSNLVKYSNLQSAVIVSPDYSNTIFSVSKITNDDGSISYIGRIINKNFFDGFELKKNTEGIYQLTKIETDRVIQDCSQQ